MITERLQEALDQALATTRQRWLLGVVAVLTALVASGSMALASEGADGWVVILVGVLALLATIWPDDHLALVVITVVVLHWLAFRADVVSAWSMGIAACLLVFHTLIALMAATPHTAVVHPVVLRRWLARSGVVAVATGAVWVLVVLFERRNAPGNAALSIAAFAVVAAAAIALRVRSLTARSTATQ
jgi:hypothetical protein